MDFFVLQCGAQDSLATSGRAVQLCTLDDDKYDELLVEYSRRKDDTDEQGALKQLQFRRALARASVKAVSKPVPLTPLKTGGASRKPQELAESDWTPVTQQQLLMDTTLKFEALFTRKDRELIAAVAARLNEPTPDMVSAAMGELLPVSGA